MNQQPRNEKNIIFAADLPENTTEEDLKIFFKDYIDKILMINMNQKKNAFTEHSFTSAKIIFRDSVAANDARLKLNQLKLKGKAIRLMWDEKSHIFRNNHNNSNLFVKGIPFSITQRKVYEHFLQFGDILSLKMSEDEYGNHIGYGYITYYDQESALKAIEKCDGKIVFNVRLEVKFFKNRAERIASYGPENNKIYITNFPGNFNENDILTLCEDYGEIISYNVNTETIGRIFAIVCYSTPESAKNAQASLNKKNIRGYNLFCEIYQSKLSANNTTNKPFIGHQFTKEGINKEALNKKKFNEFCNLVVKNIPYQVDETTLRKVFEKFGPIKSIKIEKYILVQKVKDEFKEIPTSRGYGYVCFENKDDAFKARSDMNGKYIPNYESWNRPLFVDYCLPRKEREEETKPPMLPFEPNSKINNIAPQISPFNMPNQNPPINIPQTQMNPTQSYPYMVAMSNMPFATGNQEAKPMYGRINLNKNSMDRDPKNMNRNMPSVAIDEKYLYSLESIEAQKEYLGEIIFKLIEEHPLSQQKNLTIDWIGKITGMIINIEDLNEILDVCRNENILVSRINEALELLNTK